MQHIETVTVGSGGAASITFSAIPDTFTDLLIKMSGRIDASGTAENIVLRFNGATANYSSRLLFGTGSSTGSVANSGSFMSWAGVMPGNTATANTFGSSSIYIPNYLASANKSVSIDSVSENNATAATQMLTAGLWSDTSAITSVTLLAENGQNLLQFTSASLYGITAGSDGIVAVS